jgi:DNA-binding GntR family transcriptional regulator
VASASTNDAVSGPTGSQANEAYERLLDAVVSLRLSPGSYVSELELSELIGLGRTPVREAVQRLSIEEFCERLPRRGILIAPIDLSRQIDVQEVRLELEPAAARMAAERITEPEAEALRSLLEQSSAQGASVQGSGPTPDERLHRCVAAASKNELLQRTLIPLYAHSRRHWNQQKRRGLKDPAAILHDWSEIVDAIGKGDTDAAYQHMRAHVEAAKMSLLSG